MDLSNRQMDHLHLYVPDLAKAQGFYTSVMQYKLIDTFKNKDASMEMCLISNGNGLVLVLHEKKDTTSTTFDHIAYVSDDIHADFAYIKSQNCDLITPEVRYLDFLFEHGIDYFLFKGQGGEVIEFCQKR